MCSVPFFMVEGCVFRRKSQSTFEYFLIFGVFVVIVVLASGTFKKTMKGKLIEYRNYLGNKSIGR